MDLILLISASSTQLQSCLFTTQVSFPRNSWLNCHFTHSFHCWLWHPFFLYTTVSAHPTLSLSLTLWDNFFSHSTCLMYISTQLLEALNLFHFPSISNPQPDRIGEDCENSSRLFLEGVALFLNWQSWCLECSVVCDILMAWQEEVNWMRLVCEWGWFSPFSCHLM